MEPFAELLETLESSLRPEIKRAALVEYFSKVSPADGAIALNYLMGRSLGFTLTHETFKLWTEQLTGFPDWLLQESYDVVGDWGETLSLILEPPSSHRRFGLAEFIEQQWFPLRDENIVEQGERVKSLWQGLPHKERVAMYRLLTKHRSGRELMALTTEALAEIHGLPVSVIRFRLRSFDQPNPDSFSALVASLADRDTVAELFPFQPAAQGDLEALTDTDLQTLQGEWQWNGIRTQLIRRQGQVTVWSRAGELLNDRVPELLAEAALLPDGTVLDGVLVLWEGELPRPRMELEKCLAGTRSRSSRRASSSVLLMAFDVMELRGEDIRERSLSERRQSLQGVLDELEQELRMRPSAGAAELQSLLPLEPTDAEAVKDVLPDELEQGLIRVSPSLETRSIPALKERLTQARSRRCRGILLKDLGCAYSAGRPNRSWLRLGAPRLRFGVVLLSVQEGSEARGDEFGAWTFGVFDGKDWVSVATVNARLDLVDLSSLHERIRSLIVARRGPVRLLEPTLVFELSCESVEVSTRHRSGLTLAEAKVERWLERGEASSVQPLEALRREIV